MQTEPDRAILGAALAKAFPHLDQAATVALARDARWNSLLGCWMVAAFGMHVGVELDGYVHS